MAKQYSDYHGKSVSAKDINSYTNYLDRYKDTGTAASNWMNDDSNIHFANYVRDNDSVWEAWEKSGKKDKKEMWKFGQEDWKAGGNMKDRYLAKILKNPGDLNETGSDWDDMGVVSAFKSARWGYDQAAQDKLRSSYGKDQWGREGYNAGREMQWYDAKDKAKMYGTTKGVLGGGKAPDDAMKAGDYSTQGGVDEDTPKTGGNSANNGSYFNDLSTGDWRNKPRSSGGRPMPKKKNDGTFYDSYQWVNNNSGEIWKPDPGRKVDYQPGYKPAPNDGRMEWADDPRLQQWTKTPTGKPTGGPKSITTGGPKLINGGPAGDGGPRDDGQMWAGGDPHFDERTGKYTDGRQSKKPPKGRSDYWIDPISGPKRTSRIKKDIPDDTYRGRGWANYWQQSIPDRDPNWSKRFMNETIRFGDQSQVVDRDKLAKRIQDRSQRHMDNADYLGYLSRGQLRGENRASWNQPGPIKSDYQPKIDINPFIDKIYKLGRD